MSSAALLAGLGCFLSLAPLPASTPAAAAARDGVVPRLLLLAQAGGIKGQDPETAGKG